MVYDNNRKAKPYSRTRAGRKHVARQPQDWEQASETLVRSLTLGEASS